MGGVTAFVFCLGFLFLLAADGIPATLPESTREMLRKLTLDSSLLGNIDRELQVPKEWTENAKKEGKLKIRAVPWTPSQEKTFFSPFTERYPFIEIDFFGANQEERSIKTLVAYKSGRVLTDVLLNVGGFIEQYKEANALEDIRNLPAWKNIPEGAKDPNGLWIATNVSFWCMAYNTRLVKKEDLPKSAEELLENPKWRGGNLALGNRPQLWALHLWELKGENWTKDFLTRLFNDVRPQLRKEGLGALLELLAVGEFHAVIPQAANTTYERVLRKAPISLACQEPVYANPSGASILRGAPNLNAARLFVNWFLSKEGQIALHFARNEIPAHRDLGFKELIPFSDQILGKKIKYGDPAAEHHVLPKLEKFWNELWLRGGRGR